MIRLAMLSLAVMILAACTGTPIEPSPQVVFGPTTKSVAPDGRYELGNRRLTAYVDATTGAADFIGIGASSIVSTENGITPAFSPLERSSPANGYIESRDEETWQYFGQSADGKIGWRIVYNLYLDSLNVSYIVQNNSKEPITGHVTLPPAKQLLVQPFNEDNTLNTPAADGSIRSDEHTLKPGERISFTTRWTLRDLK